MGLKCKNYVPIGRRGIYQGVILNMHLHWKKHQTLKVVVKTFSPEEVKEIAVELARLTGGIVLDIHEEDTIIMYRGKNYSQPPTEIMSPRITLSRKKVDPSLFLCLAHYSSVSLRSMNSITAFEVLHMRHFPRLVHVTTISVELILQASCQGEGEPKWL